MAESVNKKIIRKSSEGVHESQKRGTAVFPLQYTVCDTTSPFYDLWLHWHTEFEIIHVISGSYNCFIGDKECTLHEGDVCLIPGKTLHGDAIDKGSSKFESIVFDIEMIRLHNFSSDDFIADIISENIMVENIFRKEFSGDINETVARMFTALREKKPGYDSMVTGYLLVFFGLVKKSKFYTEKRFIPTHKRIKAEKMELVFDMVQKNYHLDISLDDMAGVAGFSPKYFCRVFMDLTGKTPIEYLNWYRINCACSLIRESKDKLQNIATACGFKDFSYFIKTFKKYKGTTPLKYRSFDSKNNDGKMIVESSFLED